MSLIITPQVATGQTTATITRVQSASANTGAAAAASFTVTFGANLTAGNIVAFAACSDTAVGIRLIEVGVPNLGYSAMRTSGANSTTASIGFLLVQQSGNAQVLATPGYAPQTNVNAALVAVEYSGVKLRPDGYPITNTGSSTSPSTTALTTLGSNDLLFAAFGQRGTFASEQTAWLTAPTNSYSSVLQTSSFTNTSSDRAVAFLERIVSSPGSYSTAGTQNNITWSTVSAALVSD